MSETLDVHLRALHAETLTFTQFYRLTRREWGRMSTALHRNWKLPPTVTVDDVEQEMLLGGWLAARKWSPTKGMALTPYVVWCAHSRATRWIHKQRGVEQHRRKGASQFAWCVTSMARDADVAARILENHQDGTPLAEEAHDYGALLARIPDVSTTEAGKAGLRYFFAAGGDVDRAAREMHANKEHRELFELGRTPRLARAIIRDEVRGVRALLSDGGE